MAFSSEAGGAGPRVIDNSCPSTVRARDGLVRLGGEPVESAAAVALGEQPALVGPGLADAVDRPGPVAPDTHPDLLPGRLQLGVAAGRWRGPLETVALLVGAGEEQ